MSVTYQSTLVAAARIVHVDVRAEVRFMRNYDCEHRDRL